VSGWNVPDWRDPTQYPRDRSLRQWAWEFLRRNPEYRAFWREHIEPFYDPTFQFQDVVGVVGPAHGVPANKQAKLVRHFGLETFPPSPNDDYPPLFTGTGLRYTAEREARLLLYPGQIAVIFDLTRPIKRQMAAARRVFDEEKKQGKIPGTHRNRIDQFALYLRVLDGVDAGATPTEIGAVLFGNQSTEQRLFAVRDYRDAAEKLRDKDYLFIAAGAKESDTCPD
jgi:Uncharacterized conserved protein (DUF2285)/Family of unknown function (DUF6499)